MRRCIPLSLFFDRLLSAIAFTFFHLEIVLIGTNVTYPLLYFFDTLSF